MFDRIGIVPYPVLVASPRLAVRGTFTQRLQTYEKEALYLAEAARMARAAIQRDSQRDLADAALASRNWMLSVVMSHFCLQQGLEPQDVFAQVDVRGPSGKTGVLESVVLPRAVKAGRDDGRHLQA